MNSTESEKHLHVVVDASSSFFFKQQSWRGGIITSLRFGDVGFVIPDSTYIAFQSISIIFPNCVLSVEERRPY